MILPIQSFSTWYICWMWWMSWRSLYTNGVVAERGDARSSRRVASDGWCADGCECSANPCIVRLRVPLAMSFLYFQMSVLTIESIEVGITEDGVVQLLVGVFLHRFPYLGEVIHLFLTRSQEVSHSRRPCILVASLVALSWQNTWCPTDATSCKRVAVDVEVGGKPAFRHSPIILLNDFLSVRVWRRCFGCLMPGGLPSHRFILSKPSFAYLLSAPKANASTFRLNVIVVIFSIASSRSAPSPWGHDPGPPLSRCRLSVVSSAVVRGCACRGLYHRLLPRRWCIRRYAIHGLRQTSPRLVSAFTSCSILNIRKSSLFEISLWIRTLAPTVRVYPHTAISVGVLPSAHIRR